jgi:type IV secretory pathway VirB4 component
VVCLRAYKKFTGLYDAFLTLTTLVSKDEALHTTLSLSGVSSDNAMRFSQAYLEALRWSR